MFLRKCKHDQDLTETVPNDGVENYLTLYVRISAQYNNASDFPVKASQDLESKCASVQTHHSKLSEPKCQASLVTSTHSASSFFL